MSLPTDQLPPMNGTVIESYTLQDSIGLGGTATVFKALCTKRGTVAVKILHPGKLTSVDGKRFEREFRAMKRLSHPNIIKVHQIGQYKRYPWMSMELVSGGDFSTLIQKWNDPKNPIEDKYAQIHIVMIKLCSALLHIHEADMIHRDLKPSNILLTSTENPKITDFGGVKGTAHTVATELTKLGSLVGTVAFMAPEQILGESLDPRTDLYALGAILYMSLTGKKPFEAKTMAEYLAKHLSQTPVHPCEVNPEIPQILGDICVKLLQKSPDDRYLSTSELLQVFKSSQVLQIPVGLDNILNNTIELITNNPTCIVWLQAQRGQGLRDSLKYLKRYFEPKETNLYRHYVTPEVDAPALYICTDSVKPTIDFLKEISTRIQLGTPTVFIVHHTDQWNHLTKSLQCPHHILSFKPLTTEQIQQIVRSVGIVGPNNRILSQHLLRTYQGKREYIVDVVEQKREQLKEILACKLFSFHNAPISDLCLKHQETTWQQIPPNLLPYVAAFVIYHEPISLGVIPKLFAQPLKQLQPILEWLEHRMWLQRTDSDTGSSLEIFPERLPQILYHLIPENLKESWHRRIAAFIQQKPRLKITDRKNIVHHLSAIPDHQNALPQYWHLMNEWGKELNWESIVELTEFLEEKGLLDYATIEQIELIERAHFERGEHLKSMDFNQRLLAKSPPQELVDEAAIRYFLYQHINTPFNQDDNSIDSLLEIVPDNKHRRQVTHLRACQHLINGRLDEAHRLWTSLDDRPMDRWTNHANLGIVFLDDIQYNTDHFLTKMYDRPEFHNDRWHRWYFEKLIVSGQWDALQKHLNNRTAFGLNTIYDEVFAGWADFLTGNTSRSKERLNTLVQSFTENEHDVGVLLHIARLAKSLRAPIELPKIKWSLLPRRIEDVRVQWNSIQGSQPKLDNFRLFWQRDLTLLDQAINADTNLRRTEIWEQLSPNAWGVRIQILNIFIHQDPQSKWAENHEPLFAKCARNITGDLHHWR